MRDGKQGGAAPDCLYLSIILHVYGWYFLYNPDKPCIFMQVMRKRIRVYSACRNCFISHAHIPHIKVAHMPHKYILQVSDAELIVDVYATYSIIHERRHKKFILLVLCDICNVHVYCHSSQVINVELLEYHDRGYYM